MVPLATRTAAAPLTCPLSARRTASPTTRRRIPLSDAGPDGAGEEVAVRIGQAVLKALESGGGLEQLMAAHQAVAAFHGNNYLPLLEAFYRSHRAVLFTLVDAIELEATSAERGVLDALEFIRAVRHRRGEWIEETCVVNRPTRIIQRKSND